MFLKLFICTILSTLADSSLWTGSSSHWQSNAITEPNLPLIIQPVYENEPFRNMPPHIPAPPMSAKKLPKKLGPKNKVLEKDKKSINNEVSGESANKLTKSSTASSSRKNKRRRTLEKKSSDPEVGVQSLCPPPPSPPPPPPPKTECGCGTPPPATYQPPSSSPPPPPKNIPPPPQPSILPPPPPTEYLPPPPPTKYPPPPPPPPPPPFVIKSPPPPPKQSTPPPPNSGSGGNHKPPSSPNNAPQPPNPQTAPPKCEVTPHHTQQYKFPDRGAGADAAETHCEVIASSGASRQLRIPAIFKVIPIISGIVAMKETLWQKFHNLRLTSKKGNDQL